MIRKSVQRFSDQIMRKAKVSNWGRIADAGVG
jgi:hypothetical protein